MAGTPATPTSVRVLKNVDVIALAVALVLFLVAGLPIAGWLAGAGAWALQRLINELAVRKGQSAGDVRARVGLLAGRMLPRGRVVGRGIIALGVRDQDARPSPPIPLLSRLPPP